MKWPATARTATCGPALTPAIRNNEPHNNYRSIDAFPFIVVRFHRIARPISLRSRSIATTQRARRAGGGLKASFLGEQWVLPINRANVLR